MDRLAELSSELNTLLAQLRDEAVARDLTRLAAPLAWLDEANCWLRYEMERGCGAVPRDGVPFTYIPVDLRK